MWSPLYVLQPSAISDRSPVPTTEAPRLVGQVHQDLRTLAGLDVFVSSGAFRRIVPDVAEVLQAGV